MLIFKFKNSNVCRYVKNQDNVGMIQSVIICVINNVHLVYK